MITYLNSVTKGIFSIHIEVFRKNRLMLHERFLRNASKFDIFLDYEKNYKMVHFVFSSNVVFRNFMAES